jgi:integrase
LHENSKHAEEELVFHTANGTPYNDSNLLHRHLKPAGHKLGMPWLNWHTLRRTHITLFQVVGGGSLRDAQAQLGHSKMSTTLEIYTLPIPEQQRTTVEKLSVLMANDGKLDQNPERLPLASQQIQ